MRGARACCSLKSGMLPNDHTVRWWESAVASWPSLLRAWLATCQPERAECSRSRSELRQRAIDSLDDFVSAKHLQQMIEARSHIAACHRKTSWMNNRADFDAEP